MPNPKRRHSHARQAKRRSHHHITAPLLDECPKCHEMKLSHHVCPKCGYYKGKPFIQIEKEKPKETQDKEEKSERLAQDKQETNAKE